MRRQILAALFVVASASAVVVPATAHAAGSNGFGSGANSGVAKVDRSNTWGIGALRVQKSGFGIGLVSKDGSKVRGIFNIRNVSTTATSTLKVRGSKYDSEHVTHTFGSNGWTTQYGRNVGDRRGDKHMVESKWDARGNYLGGQGGVVVRGSVRAVERSQRRFHSEIPKSGREAAERLAR